MPPSYLLILSESPFVVPKAIRGFYNLQLEENKYKKAETQNETQPIQAEAQTKAKAVQEKIREKAHTAVI